MQVQKEINKNNNSHNDDPLFDRKVDLVTAGLRGYHARSLKNEMEVSRNNALIICNYIMSMKTEINLSDNYRRTNLTLLVQFSKFSNQKPFSHGTITLSPLIRGTLSRASARYFSSIGDVTPISKIS